MGEHSDWFNALWQGYLYLATYCSYTGSLSCKLSFAFIELIKMRQEKSRFVLSPYRTGQQGDVFSRYLIRKTYANWNENYMAIVQQTRLKALREELNIDQTEPGGSCYVKRTVYGSWMKIIGGLNDSLGNFSNVTGETPSKKWIYISLSNFTIFQNTHLVISRCTQIYITPLYYKFCLAALSLPLPIMCLGEVRVES